MFTFQVIQQTVFRFSYLIIWWRHAIYISGKLKFDYLKNEKSFRGEIKTFLLTSQMLACEASKKVLDL